MEALVKTKPGKGFMEIKTVADPEPGSDEVLIKIEAAGICGSDVHFYDGSLTHCRPMFTAAENGMDRASCRVSATAWGATPAASRLASTSLHMVCSRGSGWAPLASQIPSAAPRSRPS